jgi:hypothetical protein
VVTDTAVMCSFLDLWGVGQLLTGLFREGSLMSVRLAKRTREGCGVALIARSQKIAF